MPVFSAVKYSEILENLSEKVVFELLEN